ncbi:MAG: hypothetical protein IJV13_09985 [Prevotella sp.]|nr:hypothetical protein [Prevotella sp.]
MTAAKSTSAYICILAISLMLLTGTRASAQKHYVDSESQDSVAFLRGVELSIDGVGPLMKAFSDYGNYEGALRLNLRDKYFPIVELGYGHTNHMEDITGIRYKTSAPYGKIGADINILRNKHDDYRLYVGGRYAFTSFKYDISRPELLDPVWGGVSDYSASDISANCHWIEIVFGVQAKLWGPVHLGWSARYKTRISHSEGDIGEAWYVPGYGESGSSVIGGTFNLIIVI